MLLHPAFSSHTFTRGHFSGKCPDQWFLVDFCCVSVFQFELFASPRFHWRRSQASIVASAGHIFHILFFILDPWLLSIFFKSQRHMTIPAVRYQFLALISSIAYRTNPISDPTFGSLPSIISSTYSSSEPSTYQVTHHIRGR